MESVLGLLVSLLFLRPVSLLAAPPTSQDPLMNLMLSQPKIDISTQVLATAAFDPPSVRPGEESIYRVSFNALAESIDWPTEIPNPPELELRPGARGEILQMTLPSLQPRTSFNYVGRPTRLGQFTVPEFTVKVYNQSVRVPAATLEVVSAPPATALPAQRLLLELTQTNLFAGQPVRARVLMQGPPGAPITGLSQVQLTGQGFIVDQSAVRQRIESVSRGGVIRPTYVYETALTPLTAGRLSLFAQGFSVGNHFSGTIVITGPATLAGNQAALSGGIPQYTLLDSEPVELQVKPLPRKGELPGFTGAIGVLALDPPILATNVVSLGDPVQMTVTVRGDNPLLRLIPPPPPKLMDWQVLISSTDISPAQTRPTPGGSTLPVLAVFNYTLIPMNGDVKATPKLPFCYFDPDRGTYADLTVPAIAVAVKSGDIPADAGAVALANAVDPEPEKEPVLSGLAASPGLAAGSLMPVQEQAWFPLIQLAPAVVFLALWTWDRRRRFLEQHPDVVRRRIALRGLRRERRALRRAAQAGDAPGFASRAVRALRVGSAPHYPAEPRALVGADVLQLLSEPDRRGRAGEVVRRLFVVTDASRFATTPGPAGDLLSLLPELEAVLGVLERRLET